MNEGTFVIVGAGLAGAKAAETLRAEGFDGRVVLVGEEPERPYERPPLSKGRLLGTEERDKAFVHDAGWYSAQRVELRTGTRAEAVDREAHEVVLSGGERLGYDKLLLATGSEVRRLEVPGADLDGVRYLRRIEEADALGAALTEGVRLVVVGGGWIGLEVAAAARQRGVLVTLVELDELPLGRVLGPEMARVFAELHREHGVDLRTRSSVSEIHGQGGHVTAVTLADGERLPADLVVAGIGIRPATGLAVAAGIEVGDGVLVDAGLRTSDPDVYAAGDVANVEHPLYGRRLRVEHWANALHGGPAAARAMLGRDVAFDRLPYFFSDQYDLGMEYSGHAAPGDYDRIVVRGDLQRREFVAFWLASDRPVAGMNVNVWDVTADVQSLLRTRRVVDPARLADPGVPLSELA